MSFDIFIAGILFLFFLIGVVRYALRSFLAFVLLTLYLAGLYFFPEAVHLYQPHIETVGEFFSGTISVTFIYFAAFLILTLISSILSSAYYKKRKSSMTSAEKTTSKMISIFFSLLQGGLLTGFIVIMTFFVINLYGESLPFPREWFEHSRVLTFSARAMNRIPEEHYRKFNKVSIIFTALINPESRKTFIKTESFQAFENTASVVSLAEKIVSLQQEGKAEISPSSVKLLFKQAEMRDFLNDKELFALLVSPMFIGDAERSLESISKLAMDGAQVKAQDVIPDTVLVLKNGNRVECRFLSEDKDKVYVVFGQDGISAEFYKREIEKIINIE